MKRRHKKLLCKQKLTYPQILPHHQLEQNADVLLRNQKAIWKNVEELGKYLLNEQIEFFYKQTNLVIF